MNVSEQQKIFHHIDEQLSSYFQQWQTLNTQLRITSLPDIAALAQLLQAHLFQRYPSIHVLTPKGQTQPAFIYGNVQDNASYTLQIYIPYSSESICTAPVDIALPITALYAAFHACTTSLGALPININWILEDQRVTYSTGPECILPEQQQLLQADSYLWYNPIDETPDSTPTLALGVKGLLSIELMLTTAQSSLPSHYSAIAPNAAWQLLWALHSLKDPHEEILIDGFYDAIEPVEDDVAELLREETDSTNILHHQWNVKKPLLGLSGFQQQYAHFLTPTCTISFLQSGQETNHSPIPVASTIPAHAQARLDFHLVPQQNPTTIFTQIQQHLQQHGFDQIQTHLLHALPPLYTPLSHPFTQRVHKATAAIYQQEPQIIPLTTGIAPAYLTWVNKTRPFVILPHTSIHKDQQPQVLRNHIRQLALLLLQCVRELSA
ncbi:MAG TPA: peptidase dimerization domain-containing protein [Dictyobacter sp.]|jgi:acetylornithine deacetylase/succinyl-diaminopimelate desuccinylase-like protein|nr:peptidase dimerization domain-containing protein [Dictyobacter sp.]